MGRGAFDEPFEGTRSRLRGRDRWKLLLNAVSSAGRHAADTQMVYVRSWTCLAAVGSTVGKRPIRPEVCRYVKTWVLLGRWIAPAIERATFCRIYRTETGGPNRLAAG